MAEFLNSNITGNLEEVPGIGPAAVRALGEVNEKEDPANRITNTHQLIGKYLMLKGPEEVDTMEHNDKFWYFLQSKGISSHRSGIVQCIARKVGTFIQGIYDPTIYEEGEEDFADAEE